MKLKNKILCNILALTSVFGGLLGNITAYAMVEDGASAPTAAVDPAINECDDDGFTPLMHAVAQLDVEGVKKLLDKGASLQIPTHYWIKYYGYYMDPEDGISYRYYMKSLYNSTLYSNVFEMLCDQIIVSHTTSDSGDSLYIEDYDFDYTRRYGERIQLIANMLIEHCVKNNIHLSVNTTIYYLGDNHPDRTWSVWDRFGAKIFRDAMSKRSDLFNEVTDKPVSYMYGDKLDKLLYTYDPKKDEFTRLSDY